MQLTDELPMIYTVCIMSYIAFSYGKPPKVKASIAVLLVGVACFITVSDARSKCYPQNCVCDAEPTGRFLIARSTISTPKIQCFTS